MDETHAQQLRRSEARLLGELGVTLRRADVPKVSVRIPASLARAAAAAWEREDDGETEDETDEQRVLRHRAGTLALIGLSVKENGRREGDDVLVELDAELVGLALHAADDLPDPLT